MKSRENRQSAIGITRCTFAAAAMLFLSAIGCTTWPGEPPCAFQNPTSDQLIAVVNHNSDRLQAWQCNSVSVVMKAPRTPPIPLTANLAVRREKKFRLVVGTGFTSEADFGSNDDRFWFWIRRGPTKHIYYTKHANLEVVQRKTQMPFRPDWVMDALMIPRLDPRTVREMPNDTPGARYTIFVIDETGSAAAGMQRLIWVDRCHGDVAKQLVKDARGQTVAVAEYSDHKLDRQTGIRMPHRVVLEWPSQKAAMTMSLGDIIVNPVDFAPKTWQFPNYNGYTPFDMAGQAMTRNPHMRAGHNRFQPPSNNGRRTLNNDTNQQRSDKPQFSDDGLPPRSRGGRGATLTPRVTPISHVTDSSTPNFADD